MATSELKAKLDELPSELIVRAIDKGKEIADTAFRRCEWSAAVTTYTEVIAGAQYMAQKAHLLPALYRNRSSAFHAMKRFAESLDDAKISLQLDPHNAKSNYRTGRALHSLSKFKEAAHFFSQALLFATQKGADSKELQDIEKWKAKAEKVEAEEQSKEAAKKAARRYDIDYSRFEELFDDEDEAAQSGIGDQGLVIEHSGQWQDADRVPTFQRSRADALLRQLVQGRGELDPETVSAYNGTRSLLSNMGVLQLPQRRMQQLLQPSPLPTWCAALEGMHVGTALKPETSRWLVAGLGVGATLLKAVSLSKRVTFVGIDTMQPSLARVFRETMRLNSITITTASAPASGPFKALQPKLPGLASLRKPETSADLGATANSSSTSKNVFLLQGCLESATCDVSGENAQLFDILVLDPEVFDDGLIGRRLLPSVRSAHANLLAKGAQIIPRSAKLRAAIVEMKIVPDPSETSGIDLKAHGDRCGWAASQESLSLAAYQSSGATEQWRGIPWKQLSEPFDVWYFQLDDPVSMQALPDHDKNDASVRLTAQGRANAILTWFELDLGNTCSVSSHPASGLKLWGQAIHWISPVSAAPGAILQVTASRSDTATRFELISNTGGERIGKAMPRAWEILGSTAVISACRDAITHSVRFMKQLRRDPRHVGVHTLELQSGPTCALMSMLASKAGASQVLACDMSSQFNDSNTELAKLNGLLHSPKDFGGVCFTKVHPSKLTSGSAQSQLTRPVDVLLLPIPEQGLFEGGLVKIIRTVQQNAALLSRDAIVFPSKITIWAQVVETTQAACSVSGNMDFSALFNLILSSAAAPPAVDVERFPHRSLCAPIRMTTVDLADVIHSRSSEAIISHFKNELASVQITSDGRATAVVWWWSLDLCSHASKDSLTLTNAPKSSSPWLQDIQFILEGPLLSKGENVSLSVSLTENELGLRFVLSTSTPWQTDPERQVAQLFDQHWAGAWAKVRHQRKKINEAVAQSSKLFGQVMEVAEAIAQDPASIPALIEGVHIDPQDAQELASSYRLGLY